MPVATPAPALGISSRGFVGDALPVTSGNGIAFDLISETLSLDETLTNFTGLRGTVAHAAARTRPTRQEVRGGIRMNPSPSECARWCKYVFGSALSSGTIALAEILPSCAVVLNRGGAALFSYPGVLVNRATFSGAPGQPMELNVELLGTTETVGDVSGAPVIALDEHLPWVLSDAVVTVAGTTLDCMNVEITVDNGVIQRFPNSLTATTAYRTDRMINCRLSLPYGDVPANYGLTYTGVPVVVAFSYGAGAATGTFSVTMPKVQFRKQSPPINSRQELVLELDGQARYNAAPGDEAVVAMSLPA